MTLVELAAKLRISDHDAYCLAGDLVREHGQAAVFEPGTPYLTDAAVDAITAYVTDLEEALRAYCQR